LELKELLRRLNREGKTVFITSHVLSDLEEICTSLGVMEKGKLLRVGKIEDVMRGAGHTKRVRIKLAAAGFALGAWLAARPGVSEAREEGLEAEMVFPGTDGELAALLALNIAVFFALGLAAIRNQEGVGRILRTQEGGGAGWLDLAWPAPLLVAGAAAASLIVVAGVASGALFLIIFYVCIMILMAPLGIFSKPERAAFSAFLIPSGAFMLDHANCILRPAIWIAAFLAQCLLIAVFIGLQTKAIDELNPPASAPAAPPKRRSNRV